MEVVQPVIYDYARELTFGLSMTAAILVFNGYAYSFVMMLHSRIVPSYEVIAKSFAMFAFVGCVLLVAISQLIAIVLWAIACNWVGIIPDFQQAILYSGSCFTTIGIYVDPLLVGWKTVPLLIAISGLFSFAWATAIMISMANDLKQRLMRG